MSISQPKNKTKSKGNKESIQDFDYHAWMKYKSMIRKMDNIDSFMVASQVCELGFPKFNEDIPTAEVRLNKDSNEIEFHFNPEFYFKLSVDNLAFVFTHEMLHVAFQHIQRGIRHQIKDQQRWLRWNWAIDCIVNTWSEQLGFGPSPDLKKTLCFPETLGFPNFNGFTTAEEIYAWLLQRDEKQIKELEDFLKAIDNHGSWEEMQKNGGSGNPKMDAFAEKVVESMKSEFFKNGQKSFEKMNADRLRKQSQEKKPHDPNKNIFVQYNKPSQNSGNQISSELRYYQNLKDRVSTDVLRLIHKKIKSARDIWPKETWMRRPRKFASHPDIVLPSEHEQDTKCKYKALVVLDCSGSITPDQIAQAVRYVRSFPYESMDYTVIAFDTKVYELNKAEFYDRNKYPKIPGGGGTEISLPEQYIQNVFVKKHKARPDIAIIITDGDGPHSCAIAPKFQKDYVWVLTKRNRKEIVKAYCPGGIIYETNIQ